MKRRPYRSTPAGQHRPVMLNEVLQVFGLDGAQQPQPETPTAPESSPSKVLVDCTLGFAGHAVELSRRLGPTGLLIGLDRDGDHLPAAQERLAALGFPFHVHHANFAGLEAILQQHQVAQVHGILADLGMSSMQVDNPERGFSYRRDGPLDMRMDRSRGQTAAQVLATISESDLRQALTDLGDEPHAAKIAAAIVRARAATPLNTTRDLAELIQKVTGQAQWQLRPAANQWTLHPAALTFQTLRLLVNRELGNLENLLRVAPSLLHSSGVLAIISFHSGEDRLVKQAFRQGLAAGVYAEISPEPLRASYHERGVNPRARSAKLRWARRA